VQRGLKKSGANLRYAGGGGQRSELTECQACRTLPTLEAESGSLSQLTIKKTRSRIKEDDPDSSAVFGSEKGQRGQGSKAAGGTGSQPDKGEEVRRH